MSDTFDADDAKSRAEVDLIRAQAEAQRATGQAAKDKAAAEIAQIRMPFFMRATFWTAMIPILTLAGTAVYTLDRGYFHSEMEVLKVQTEFLAFKKKTYEAQNSAIKKQIRKKTAQLNAMKNELAEEPIRVLIDTLNVHNSIDSILPLPSSMFGEMVHYVKASPHATLPLLEKYAKTVKRPYERLVLMAVGLASTNKTAWFDRMLTVGRNAIKAPDEKQIENTSFWGLFVGNGMDSALSKYLFTPERRKESCEMLAKSFTALATVKSKAAVADAIVSSLIPCGPNSKVNDYSFFKMPAEEWNPIAEAVVHHLGFAKIASYTTRYYADIVARTDPLAAALLFAAKWKESGWSPLFARDARDLLFDLSGWRGAAELPSEKSGIAEWKRFLTQNTAKLDIVRTKPIDMWPQS